MASLQWDRLLETCYRRNASDILLSPGSPPMIRLSESWRTLQAPPVDTAAIQALVAERFVTAPDGEHDGYAYSDFAYKGMRRFRAMAFGYPATFLLLIARYPAEDSGGGAEH
jgi:Tfp pilus assembly pilus retraction ATPase PilT